MNKKYYMATHTDLDGVGCAILAYLAFGQDDVDADFCDYKNINDRVTDVIKAELYYGVYDKMFITDISVNDEVAAMIDEKAARLGITLLDHHATALDLNKYIWCDVRVEDKISGIKHSGTELFYMHLHNHGYFDKYNNRVQSNIRRFAEIVRDYDTWRWKEFGDDGIVCKQLNDLFHIYGRDKFIEWALHNILELDSFPYFLETDRVLLENRQKDIDIYVDMKDKQVMVVEDNFGYRCGVVFADRYVSELGNRLSELNPGLAYIALIDISRGMVSYRTIHENIDLGGEIAHSFGGGGHRKAAGSTFDTNKIHDVVMKELFGNDIAIW